MAVIECRELTKVYNSQDGHRVEALGPISICISQGEFVSLVGPSGCGKSTLLKILAGLISPTKGEFLLNGNPVIGPGRERAIVFQEFALFPWRTVLSNIAFGLENYHVPRAAREARALALIESLGLKGFERSYPHELSGGMKQRVGIARALIMEPQVLLMDEPFASLDAQMREILQEELERIWMETQKTVVFVTHSIDEALFLSDRIIVMSARPGRITIEQPLNLPRPRGEHDVRNHPTYQEARKQIWDSLRLEVLKNQPVSQKISNHSDVRRSL